MDGQGYGTMNEGDGKGAKRNRSVCLAAKELEAFCLLYCFCTRKEEEIVIFGCRNWKVGIVMRCFSFLKL
jgi:hypothetical protein